MKSRARISRTLLAGMLVAGVASAPLALAVAADMQGIADYYRRKQNLPPDIDIKVHDVQEAKIPGAKAATLTLSRGDQSQSIEILLSADGRYVVFAEVEDVTADPFAEIAKKIEIEGQPVRGNRKAAVTIVEYSDFQCPYCARAHKTVTEQVMKEYGDKVRLVYKNFPLAFHKWAEPAGIAGECALDQKEDAFWQLYDYYFEHQQEITPENVRERSLAIIGENELDTDKWVDCYDNKKTIDRVRADMAEGQSIGVTGTPAFIINGRTLSGAQPFEKFKAIIDDELQRKGGSS